MWGGCDKPATSLKNVSNPAVYRADTRMAYPVVVPLAGGTTRLAQRLDGSKNARGAYASLVR